MKKDFKKLGCGKINNYTERESALFFVLINQFDLNFFIFKSEVIFILICKLNFKVLKIANLTLKLSLV